MPLFTIARCFTATSNASAVNEFDSRMEKGMKLSCAAIKQKMKPAHTRKQAQTNTTRTLVSLRLDELHAAAEIR